jgi:uroporphyrinogen decarboxylase
MESRERVHKAIGFDWPDRVPVSHAILPSALLHYGDRLREILTLVHEDFGWDFLPDLPVDKFPPYYRKGRHADGFGVIWESSDDGEYGIPVVHPLADWEKYESFVWPDFPVNPATYRLYSGHMTGSDPRWYSRGGWITFFETMQELRGFEDLLADMAMGEDAAYRLRDDLLQFNLRLVDKFLALDYDGIHFADDWGTQQSLMIDPAMWRRFFKPCYATMFERVRAAGKHVHFHSDGYILDIIGDLIDIGASVINCQSNCMGNEGIGRRFRGSVCFRTDLDRQNIMTFGSPSDVKKHIGEMFGHFGSAKGGLIACGEIGRDTPLENIRAMYEAFGAFNF